MGYPLVNLEKTMDNHTFSWVNPVFQWPFSSSQSVNVYQRVYPINIPLNHYKIPLNYYKSMVFHRFSMVFHVKQPEIL